MRIDQSFEVAAPADRVWAALIDVDFVAPCLPGTQITGADEDGAHQGTFSVKLGPATAVYAGSLRRSAVDEATRTVVIEAEGQDTEGPGAATATIRSRVSDSGARSRVDVVTDLMITGRLARFAAGGTIEDVADRVLREFAESLQGRIGGAREEAVRRTSTDAALDRAADSAAARPTAASPEEAGTLTPAREPANVRTASASPTAPTARPVQGGPLLSSALADRIRALFRRVLRRRR
jgi:carbon monoxide dehydrogenase subunit G